MQCAKARKYAVQIIFGLGFFLSCWLLIPPLTEKADWYGRRSPVSGVNVQLATITEVPYFPRRKYDRPVVSTKLQFLCSWCDFGSDNPLCYNEGLRWDLKPNFQTRLPAISTIFNKDSPETSMIKETTVLLVSVDMCSPNKHQKVSVVPAIPSQYKVFAVMQFPCFNKSLPYVNILAAQRAGYAGVLIFENWCFKESVAPRCPSTNNATERYLSDKIFIPVLLGYDCSKTKIISWHLPWHNKPIPVTPPVHGQEIRWSDLKNLDFSPAKILVVAINKKLEGFKTYLGLLYFWLPVGPVITLIWLIKSRRRKPPAENQNIQPDGNSITNDDSVISNITADNRTVESENTPLLTPNQTRDSQGTIRETSNGIAEDGRFISSVKAVIRYTFNLFWLLPCLVLPLPFGISAGGLSFIRLDENDPEDFVKVSFIGGLQDTGRLYVYLKGLVLLWSPIQVTFFFIYSTMKCRKLWTVHNNISKVIRCSWFKTSVFLFVFCFIAPLCVINAVTVNQDLYNINLAYYIMGLNTLNSTSNILFLLILNKYSECTLFVLYASVCMICAYIESSVVIVIYFMLSSSGSLDNLKTTALRTIEITTALGFSFQTSMHIIHKIRNPQESLFTGLSES